MQNDIETFHSNKINAHIFNFLSTAVDAWMAIWLKPCSKHTLTSTFITDSVIKSEPKVKILNVANTGSFVYFCHHKS